jgi:nucleoside-diphosphate-sugar epimerase
MRVVVIGGSGHIGTYLSPRLVERGHEVLCVSRGHREPYHDHQAWKQITRLTIDRAAENFAERIAGLRPDAVVDLTCYTLESTQELVATLRGRIGHFLHCGTIWVHGYSVFIPTREAAPRRPFGDYGCRKAAIEACLLQEARERAFPATVLHPGHLVGPGWFPINPAGNFNPEVFERLGAGQEVFLPNLGMETVHHVHCDDVAQAFERTLVARDRAFGESFHVVSAAAMTLRGYSESMAEWFGQQARLRFLPWEEWRAGSSERDAAITWDHIAHSPNCSIEKARAVLGYEPEYSGLAAVQESVQWLIENGKIRANRA